MEIFFLPRITPTTQQECCLVDEMGDNEKYGYAVDPAKIDYNIKLISRLTGRQITDRDEPFAIGQYVVYFGKTNNGIPSMDFFSHDVQDEDHMNAILRTIFNWLPEDDFYSVLKQKKEQLKKYNPALHDTVGLAMVGYA
jgi:hypothetical protein